MRFSWVSEDLRVGEEALMESSKAVILAASAESMFLNDFFAGTAMNRPGWGSGPGTAGENDKSEESKPDLGSDIMTFWLVIFGTQMIVKETEELMNRGNYKWEMKFFSLC